MPTAERRTRRQLHDDGCHRAARLLKPMLDPGISRDHPDPVAAIEDAQKL
jgi:hypothetical protein